MADPRDTEIELEAPDESEWEQTTPVNVFPPPSDPTFDVTKIRCGGCGAEVLHDAGACKPTAIRILNAAAAYFQQVTVVDDSGARRLMTRTEAADHAQAIVRSSGIILD